MNDLLIAIGGTGLVTTMLNRIVEGFFSRRRAKADAQRVEAESQRVVAEADHVDVSTLELLQRMYMDAMKEVRTLADEVRTQSDEVRALNKKVDACDEERRELLAKVDGLERKLGIVKEAL